MDVTEDAKYAFLLGSALRNEDTEQLFVVYDNLIPEDISESRLEYIKEEARHISELPEPEFSTLVLNARNYSLALGHSSMNHTSRQGPLAPSDHKDDHCVAHSLKQNKHIQNHVVSQQGDPDLCNVAASSTFYKVQTTAADDFDIKIDLGLIAASAGDDSGVPDFLYKTSSSLKNSTSCSDSTYGDSEEDRPGSFDYMPCQSHFRIVHSFNPTYDEEVRVDSGTDGSSIESPRSETSVTHDEYNLAEEGTEMATISYKETPQPFSREHKHSDGCKDYILGGKHPSGENAEDDKKRDRLQCSYVSSFPIDAPIQVDKGISYGLKRLDGSGHPARPMTFSSNNQYRDQYKLIENKDKLNRHFQDDSEKPDVSGLVDINGNPKPLETANNSQMHQLPRGKSENTAASGSQASLTPATIPQSYSSSSADSNTLDRKKERKRMKQERQKWTPAEAYEDHKEFNDIKEILDFVEGPHSASKSEGKPAKKKQERSKKKDHHLNGPLVLEDTAGGEDGPDLMETVVVTIKPGPEAMGNSSVKSLSENNISVAESTEENFDKNSEFHDCLNTLPTELVILDKVESAQQSHQIDNTIKASIYVETDKGDVKGHNNIDKILTDNDKIKKKSTKVKNRKDKQEVIKDNGPLSLTANMVKHKESLAMKDSLLLKSVSPKDNRNFHYSSDTELPSEVKREDSFTEVKKRKKRPVGKDFISTSSNHSSLSYHSHNINGHTHSNNPRPRPFTPPLLPAVTVVSSSSSLPVSGQTSSTRDLSPSAFPVLLGHVSMPSHTDNRRNSCGDISTDSVDNKIYDSDRESAKSLPDARGARVGGDVSPVCPLSYARIAAAPRRNDNTNSPSSESGVTSGSQNSSINSSVTHTPGSSIDIMSPQSPSKTAIVPERKTTVWKGSPRERRHSIGSSPEDKEDKEKNSVTQRNRQCGSQEVLSRDTASSAKVSSNGAASSLPVVVHNAENCNGLDLDKNLQDKTQQSFVLVLSKSKNTVPSAQSGIKSLAQSLSKPTSFEYATSNNTTYHTQGSTITMPSKLTTVSDSTKENIKTELNSSLSTTVADPNKNKKVISHQDNTTTNMSTVNAEDVNVKTTINKQKVIPTSRVTQKLYGSSNNTKSVIFLDKRFGSSSLQNLGITFGFDLGYESLSEPASQSTSQQQQPVLTSLPQSVSSSLSSSSVGPSVNISTQPSCLPTNHPHIPSAAETAIVSSKQPSISFSQSSDNNNSILPKVSHIQGLCNGLILPSSPAGHTEISQESNANVSISLCNDNNTNLSSLNRTSLSTLNQGALVTHSINTQRTPGPSALSGLTNSLPATVTNSNCSLAQSNKSSQGTGNVTTPQTNPLGVSFSPSHPPPPIPQGVHAPTSDKTGISNTTDKTGLGDNTTDKANTNNSTSALPLTQDKQEPKIENVNYTGSTEPTNSASSNPALSAKAGDTAKIMEAPSATIKVLATLLPETEAALQKQQHSLPVSAEVFHVVYGEKIRPVTGCGKLLFKQHSISQNNKGNAADLASFLKKKWLDDVALRKGSSAFVTLTED